MNVQIKDFQIIQQIFNFIKIICLILCIILILSILQWLILIKITRIIHFFKMYYFLVLY